MAQQLDLFGMPISPQPAKPTKKVEVAEKAVEPVAEQIIVEEEIPVKEETIIKEELPVIEETTDPVADEIIVELEIPAIEKQIAAFEEEIVEQNKPIVETLIRKPAVIEVEQPIIETVYQDIQKRKRGRPRKIKPFNEPPKVKQKRGRKSFAEISAKLDLINIPPDEELNKKQYYSISTVAQWFNVNNSQIRLWENQFDILQPKKNGKGNRLFRPEDVRNLKVIYHLLRQRKFSVEGAKEYLSANQHKTTADVQIKESLQNLKSFLLELKANL